MSSPEGRFSHVAAPTESGWLVVDVWASEASFNRFGKSLMPIIAGAGITPPQPEIYPAHNYVPG